LRRFRAIVPSNAAVHGVFAADDFVVYPGKIKMMNRTGPGRRNSWIPRLGQTVR
jgi:hypothetical protein